jgi:methyl-accepting chemotaxis protein
MSFTLRKVLQACFGTQVSPPPPPPEPGQTPGEVQALVQRIAHQASHLGRDAAHTRGALEDTQQVVQAQVDAMQALMQQLDGVAQAQQAISDATGASLAAVASARGSVVRVSSEVQGIVQVLQEVSTAAEGIGQIALQTRLVAFNATVEAHRAGVAGQGFGVVANAVKDLATRVESASRTIQSTLAQLNERIDAFANDTLRDAPPGAQSTGLHGAFAAVESAVRHIDEASQTSRQTCDEGHARGAQLSAEMQRAMTGLDGATACSDRFLSLSEHMIQDLAQCGCVTEDTPYIESAQAAAQAIGKRLEHALSHGQIELDALFDERYQPIPGSQPAQYTARYNALADKLFPEIQEAMLTRHPGVVFCIAVDRNGYVSTHNRAYCQPQRADPVWNAAHSRWRRIFNDRTGLASARSQDPFLLQTYRRDMGGGQFLLLKEASAPIRVQGRHWGGLRLAYKFA